MTGTTTVLVTGANRGIGKGILSVYLSRPNYILIPGLRDTTSTSSKALYNLPHSKGSKLILVKIDSASETDALSAVNTLKSNYGITRLYIAIANAGISNYFGKAVESPAKEMFEHFKVNCVGPLLLFQASAPLLSAVPNVKFVVISSGAGSLSNMENLKVENTAYGLSKAAANFITRKIHFENPNLIDFPINPGWL